MWVLIYYVLALYSNTVLFIGIIHPYSRFGRNLRQKFRRTAESTSRFFSRNLLGVEGHRVKCEGPFWKFTSLMSPLEA
jgi:hypothetical protein